MAAKSMVFSRAYRLLDSAKATLPVNWNQCTLSVRGMTLSRHIFLACDDDSGENSEQVDLGTGRFADAMDR
jgi:hypothetical protein